MRRPRNLDFKCPLCATTCTRFVETYDDDTPLEPEVCGAVIDCPYGHVGCETLHTCTEHLVAEEMAVFRGYMKTITKGSHDYNERERERLEKRSDEHWKRSGRDEAIDRERALFKKHGMEGVGGIK